MPWSGSNFTRTDGTRTGSDVWTQAKDAGVKIVAADQDTHDQDLADGIKKALRHDGGNAATANLPMGTFRHTGVGNGSARTDYAALGQLQDGTANWVDGGGTADAITATYSPAITTVVDGQLCFVRATAANATTTPTFAPNGLTARTIVKNGGVALVAGDIVGDGHQLILRYDLANTRWELLNPAMVHPTASDTVAGIVELATTAETTTGTDATRAVTPDSLHDMTSLAGAAWFLDEDDMASDSATQVPSQQSVKAYVDTSVAAVSSITLATAQAATTGTSIDFTGIPASTKCITIMFDGVSTTGSSDIIVQLGDSGGIEATGYGGSNVDSSQASGVVHDVGFILNNLQAAGDTIVGTLTLSLVDAATFKWAMTSIIADDASTNVAHGAGLKALSAELDRVRITTVGGTETFDAGTINIQYGS